MLWGGRGEEGIRSSSVLAPDENGESVTYGRLAVTPFESTVLD